MDGAWRSKSFAAYPSDLNLGIAKAIIWAGTTRAPAPKATRVQLTPRTQESNPSNNKTSVSAS